MNAAYYRAWRAAHPDYRARQTELRRKRRAMHGRGDRSAEYAHRASRALSALAEMPPMHVGHPLFEEARAIVGPRRTTLITVYDPLYDDLLSEATLALLEGRDAAVAVKTYRIQEHRWGRVTAPLLAESVAA